jgi:hypothetical protein
MLNNFCSSAAISNGSYTAAPGYDIEGGAQAYNLLQSSSTRCGPNGMNVTDGNACIGLCNQEGNCDAAAFIVLEEPYGPCCFPKKAQGPLRPSAYGTSLTIYGEKRD